MLIRSILTAKEKMKFEKLCVIEETDQSNSKRKLALEKAKNNLRIKQMHISS